MNPDDYGDDEMPDSAVSFSWLGVVLGEDGFDDPDAEDY